MKLQAVTSIAALLLSRFGVASDVASERNHEGSAAPWRQYIFSPSTRDPAPVRVHSKDGDAKVRACSKGNHVLTMKAGSRVSMDFGIEVGGHVGFNLRAESREPLTLAFAESPSLVRNISDDTGATPTMDWDQAMVVELGEEADGHAYYQTPPERFRGGFRFLTFNALSDVTVHNITCQIGFAPNMPDLRSGTGYFYTSDPGSELLNRIWYAGAYTVQTNIAPANTGRHLPQVRPGWAYNATLSVASPSLVDGAKRDRAIWPGDMGIEGPVAMMAYGAPGREAFVNSLATLFHYQNATTGLLPFAGPATGSFNSGSKSDTYHAWGLIGIYEYVIYSGDTDWLDLHWSNVTRAVNYIVDRLDPQTGLQNQTNENDWARRNTGGFNSALNALDYHVLRSLASVSPDEKQASTWRRAARRLKKQFNALLWDESVGLYRDNTMSDLHPQDGNALALYYGLTESEAQISAIGDGLEGNWNDIGPVTPELADTISPFISSVELLAHLHGAENPARALKLMRRLWGYMLEADTMTGSTFIEGMTANGSLSYRYDRSYNYDTAYTSLSHGWSTGPTMALINGILGLRLTAPGGSTWELKPQLGDLGHVQTGFETGSSRFEVEIKVEDDGVMRLDITAPPGSRGTITLPASARKAKVNGRMHSGQRKIAMRGN